jgi:hypothetical protein
MKVVWAQFERKKGVVDVWCTIYNQKQYFVRNTMGIAAQRTLPSSLTRFPFQHLSKAAQRLASFHSKPPQKATSLQDRK